MSLLEKAGLKPSRKKSLITCMPVMCEVYGPKDSNWGRKEILYANAIFNAFTAWNIVHAKVLIEAVTKVLPGYMNNSLPTLMTFVWNYWGFEFSVNDRAMPPELGGWIPWMQGGYNVFNYTDRNTQQYADRFRLRKWLGGYRRVPIPVNKRKTKSLYPPSWSWTEDIDRIFHERSIHDAMDKIVSSYSINAKQYKGTDNPWRIAWDELLHIRQEIWNMSWTDLDDYSRFDIPFTPYDIKGPHIFIPDPDEPVHDYLAYTLQEFIPFGLSTEMIEILASKEMILNKSEDILVRYAAYSKAYKKIKHLPFRYEYIYQLLALPGERALELSNCICYRADIQHAEIYLGDEPMEYSIMWFPGYGPFWNDQPDGQHKDAEDIVIGSFMKALQLHDDDYDDVWRAFKSLRPDKPARYTETEKVITSYAENCRLTQRIGPRHELTEYLINEVRRNLQASQTESFQQQLAAGVQEPLGTVDIKHEVKRTYLGFANPDAESIPDEDPYFDIFDSDGIG
eukprot:GHVR01079826.1.p1 GENE.GHVR01079826.1~~GHVR01079826.1.p1  ORF type:complete len:534 (+),score=29.50 GHVR01079826.1:77-1603(+)